MSSPRFSDLLSCWVVRDSRFMPLLTRPKLIVLFAMVYKTNLPLADSFDSLVTPRHEKQVIRYLISRNIWLSLREKKWLFLKRIICTVIWHYIHNIYMYIFFILNLSMHIPSFYTYDSPTCPDHNLIHWQFRDSLEMGISKIHPPGGLGSGRGKSTHLSQQGELGLHHALSGDEAFSTWLISTNSH